MQKNSIKLGIGFATGRKSFRKVLNSYTYCWKEFGCQNPLHSNVSLNLFVAYDVDYSDAQSTDFTNLSQDIVDVFDEITFLGSNNSSRDIRQLIDDGSLSPNDAKLLFGGGYAGKRNAIMYAALENNIDYLLFLDDDEYPVAVTKNRADCLWGGQHVLSLHLQHIKNADITNGHHCGYISPIPHIEFNDVLTELDFSRFIESISNDIISWESIRRIMQNGGVTYADTSVLLTSDPVAVNEVKRCKFISGSNLCINLTNPERTFPFFNPPGARGEDTFLSTLLSDRKVMRIPCYTFHDGFSAYKHLLDGVLPLQLAPISTENGAVVTRFYNACIGWVRYKPLLVYITDPENYDNIIKDMKTSLSNALPKICAYFGREDFMQILCELDAYANDVKEHYDQFNKTQSAWQELLKKRRYRHKF